MYLNLVFFLCNIENDLRKCRNLVYRRNYISSRFHFRGRYGKRNERRILCCSTISFFSLAETTQLDGRNQKQSGRFSLLQLLMNINKGPGLTDRYRFYRNRIELIPFGRSSIVFFSNEALT